MEAVWELIGDPRRHPEWWPPVVGVKGDDFEVGDVHTQWWRVAGRTVEYPRIIERREELRELAWRCPTIGTHCRWSLTEARGGTFLEMTMHIEPTTVAYRLFDVTAAPFYLRRWVDEALDGLERALGESTSKGSRRIAVPLRRTRGG